MRVLLIFVLAFFVVGCREWAEPSELPVSDPNLLLKGVDADGNGSLDSVDRLVASSAVSPSDAKSLLLYGSILQRAVLANFYSHDELKSIKLDLVRLLRCKSSDLNWMNLAYQILSLNTSEQERSDRFYEFTERTSGFVFSEIDLGTCS